MKKILMAAAALLFAVACAAPPTNRDATNTTNSTNRAAETSSAAPTEADLVAKEKAIWDALKKKDYEGFGAMLADNSIEVATDAVYDKAGSVNGVKTFEPTEVDFADWKFTPIDKDAAVISYTVTVKGKMKGQEMPPMTMRASSAWVNRDGKWLAIYHQESEVMKQPPAPAADKAAKPAASPAATVAQLVTGSDPVANEKLVWAAFKAKNYDGFGSVLAPEQTEVETTGVYDKAGTIKGVQQFDGSKAELSDFKSVKIDDDAALVTYLVTMSGAKPEKQRHTTIWVNRNGKWLAVFHQGTPVGTMPGMNMATPKATK